ITLGLVRDLPRSEIEVQVFSIGAPDDALARAFAAGADRFVALPARLEDVRAAIAQAEPDVLLFADIGMHPLTYFLAQHRLAPVQMMTWGHPVTSGIDAMDWYLSAQALEREDAQSHYSERLLRLQAFFLPGYE